MRIVTIIGTRPQYIKVALVTKLLRQQHTEILVDTGQHYDYELSQAFLDELEIPLPDYNLKVGSGSHATQISRMLTRIEKVLLAEHPDLVLVYGDTNSTFAGALAASRLNIPIGHIEAGPREYDMRVPEEANRIFTDHLSRLLFCPTELSVSNLKKEGIVSEVYLTGDVMYDEMLKSAEIAEQKSDILSVLGLQKRGYLVGTFHHTDVKEEVEAILNAILKIGEPIVIPLHPRMRKNMRRWSIYQKLAKASNAVVTKPLGYFDFLKLEMHARKILTDSGGVQKEAYWFRVPCITVFGNSPWPETIEQGWNKLVGYDVVKIVAAINDDRVPKTWREVFGNGRACEKIVNIINDFGAGC